MAQCPECEMFSATDVVEAAWAATYQHEDGCSYDPESFSEDDGYRFDPVTGESRIYREA